MNGHCHVLAGNGAYVRQTAREINITILLLLLLLLLPVVVVVVVIVLVSSYYHQQQQQQLRIMSHDKLLYKGHSESFHAFFVGHWCEVNFQNWQNCNWLCDINYEYSIDMESQ